MFPEGNSGLCLTLRQFQRINEISLFYHLEAKKLSLFTSKPLSTSAVCLAGSGDSLGLTNSLFRSMSAVTTNEELKNGSKGKPEARQDGIFSKTYP